MREGGRGAGARRPRNRRTYAIRKYSSPRGARQCLKRTPRQALALLIEDTLYCGASPSTSLPYVAVVLGLAFFLAGFLVGRSLPALKWPRFSTS